MEAFSLPSNQESTTFGQIEQRQSEVENRNQQLLFTTQKVIWSRLHCIAICLDTGDEKMYYLCVLLEMLFFDTNLGTVCW